MKIFRIACASAILLGSAFSQSQSKSRTSSVEDRIKAKMVQKKVSPVFSSGLLYGIRRDDSATMFAGVVVLYENREKEGRAITHDHVLEGFPCEKFFIVRGQEIIGVSRILFRASDIVEDSPYLSSNGIIIFETGDVGRISGFADMERRRSIRENHSLREIPDGNFVTSLVDGGRYPALLETTNETGPKIIYIGHRFLKGECTTGFVNDAGQLFILVASLESSQRGDEVSLAIGPIALR